MKGKRGAPWVAELVVIVVGVLVALAVDDLAQGRADRELEAHLLQRLSEDLVADASDLALAQVHVARRQWLFGELARVLDEGGPPSPPPDSILNMRRHGALLEAAGRLDEADWARSWDDSFDRPLFALRGSPDFDLSDDSYREMLEAGALRTLRDHDLRSAIMAYYRTAEDDAANVMNVDQYKDRFTEDLLRTGTAVTDSVPLDRIVQFLRQDAALAARVRQVRFRSANQAFFLNRIEGARLALEERLSQRGGR